MSNNQLYAQCIAILDPIGVPWTFLVRSGRPSVELMRVADEFTRYHRCREDTWNGLA